MRNLLRLIFTWWNGQTFAGRAWTLLTGDLVGVDGAGNHYYQNRKGRRWVIYRGVVEASKVPPLWFNWLHYLRVQPPAGEEAGASAAPNMTGTPLAHQLAGSLLRGGQRTKATGDYQAWTPQEKAKSQKPKRSRYREE